MSRRVASIATVLTVWAAICVSTSRATIDGIVENATPLNNSAASDTSQDYDVAVATDGSGNWVAVWTSNDPLGDTIGPDYDILVARSSDNGINWTDPQPLNANATTDLSSDLGPQIATDGSGQWVAVWWSPDSLGDTIGTDQDILFARSTDNGESWTEPAPLNTNATSDNQGDLLPRIAADRSGRWVAVWELDGRLDGVFGPDDDVLVARSTDGGATWADPASLNTNAAVDGISAHDNNPSLATDGNGLWVAVWESRDSLDDTIDTDDDILVARSTDGGASWSVSIPLNGNAAIDSGGDGVPEVAADGLRNWVAVWQSNDNLDGIGTDFDILVASSENGAMDWSWPAALSPTAYAEIEPDLEPQIATDGSGDWTAVWRSKDSLGGTIGGDDDLLIARSTDNGASWTAAQPLNDYAGSDGGYDWGPRVATDGAGRWLAAWFSTSDLGGTGVDQDILFTRFVLHCDVFAPRSGYGRLLFPRRCAQDAGDLEHSVFASRPVGLWREADEVFRISGDVAGFHPLVAGDRLLIDSQDAGIGPYELQPGVPPYQLDAPIGVNLRPLPAPDISALIPSGSSEALFELVSTEGWIYGNTALYVIRDCGMWVGGSRGMPTVLHYVSHDVQIGGAAVDLEAVSGLLSELRADGDFDRASCLGQFGDSALASDSRPAPPSTEGYYYLLRGSCSDPTFGSSSLTPDPRDALDGVGVCP